MMRRGNGVRQDNHAGLAAGKTASHAQALRLAPESGLPSLPIFEDEREIAGERIEQSLRVAGMTRAAATRAVPAGDIELIDDAGQSVLVELKVRHHDPKPRDIDAAHNYQPIPKEAQGNRICRWPSRLTNRTIKGNLFRAGAVGSQSRQVTTDYAEGAD
jgi:hypothetical protein